MDATTGFGADGFFDKRSKLTAAELAEVLVAAPLLPRLAEILEELIQDANKDRADGPEVALEASSGFPVWFLLADAAASRAFGSDHNYRLHTTPGRRSNLYDRMRQVAWAVHGVELPRNAPSRGVSRSMRSRLAQPDLLPLFKQAFYRACRELAHDLGALLPSGPGEDTGQIRLRLFNLLLGDGTIVDEFSAVKPIEIAGEVVDFQNTRAERNEDGFLVGKPRVQQWRTATYKDGKGDKRGINFVHVGTETRHGYLVLAADMADGSESIAAMDMLKEVLADPAVSADAVVYDRAITGHHAEELLGRYGVPVISRPVANTDTTVAAPELVTQATAAKNKHVERARKLRAAEMRRRGKKDATAKNIRLPKAVREFAEQQAIRELRDQNPGPLGLGVEYRADKHGHPAFVHTRVEEFGVARHDIDGEPCLHRLVVDDTLLWAVGEDGLKNAQVALAGVEFIQAHDGTFTQRATFQIPCSHGAFPHVDEFTPNTNGKLSSSERDERTSRERARSAMRVYALLGEVHENVKNRRSLTESWHAWLNDRLGAVGLSGGKGTGRAMSLQPEQQLLDYLFTALAFNADKWHRAHRGTNRDPESLSWS